MPRPRAERDRCIDLSAGEVHLWKAPLNVDADTLASLSRALDREECDCARRFRFEYDRLRWTAARGWLRRLLAGYLGANPAELRFRQDEFGKPRLAAPSQWLRFNVSHSADMAVFAVAHSREVGVDLELVSDDLSSNPVPSRFLSEREQAALVRLSGRTRARTSLQYWTGKEAYLKAVGLGLRGPVAEIDIATLPQETISVTARPRIGIFADWSLYAFDAGPDYVGAIAVQGRGARVPVAPSHFSSPGSG